MQTTLNKDVEYLLENQKILSYHVIAYECFSNLFFKQLQQFITEVNEEVTNEKIAKLLKDFIKLLT